MVACASLPALCAPEHKHSSDLPASSLKVPWRIFLFRRVLQTSVRTHTASTDSNLAHRIRAGLQVDGVPSSTVFFLGLTPHMALHLPPLPRCDANGLTDQCSGSLRQLRRQVRREVLCPSPTVRLSSALGL